MERDDQESPTSSPVPGPSRGYEDELSMAGEAEAYRTGDEGEELLAGPSYRFLPGEEPSPAPSHSGLQADYDMINVHQEDSMSLSRQFEVFAGSSSSSTSSSTAPCSSSSHYILASGSGATFQSLPSTSRSRAPGSSDPVFSAHSQPLHNELLGHPSDWDSRAELPMSSSWGVSESQAVDWPGPSGLEQAVPGQLSLEEDQDSRDLQWTASSSGIDRHLDYSEDNSLESEVQQSFNHYGSIESSSFSPQPSCSRVSPLAEILSAGPGPSQSAQPVEAEPRVTAKRSISFPDSPTAPDSVKRPRLLMEDNPDSPHLESSIRPSQALRHNDVEDIQADEEIILLNEPSRSVPLLEGPSGSDSNMTPSSMASQITREIENCLKEDSFTVSSGPSGRVVSSEAGPSSPRGSEVLAAGPSRASDDVQIDIELHHSPSGSEVGTAGPSRPSSVREVNPDSPAPSESDADEAGPSHRGYTVRFGPGPNLLEREAAPVGRPSSPVGQMRNRRNLSDSCLISSSTGPVDSNPPTPEMFGISGDIDSDYAPSPPVRRFINRFDDDEAVVDSTVDSTNIPFIMNDYEGNEVSQMEDESDGGEDTESEASSTTSARYESDHRLNLPGQDDNEGISTSGQVDIGQFRLVPNDFELPFDRRNISAMEAPAPQFVPDVQEIELDEGHGAEALQASPSESQNRQTVATFKKPYNKKDRLIDNSNLEIDDPIPGPSRLQQPSHSRDSFNGQNQSNYEPASLFLVQEDYTNNLGIGLAFSGLPSSVTLSKATQENDENKVRDSAGSQDSSSLTGPLAKRLKTRHFQEQAKANLETSEERSIDIESGEVGVSGSNNDSEILRLTSAPEASRDNGGNETSRDMETGNDNTEEQQGAESSSKCLGGVQQNYSVTLETNNVYLSALQPKRNVHTKSAGELKEYLPVTYEALNLRDNTFDSLESFLSAETVSVSGAAMMISDQPVQSRAVASLPTNYLSLRQLADQQAVIAVRNIPISCRFGPMEGRMVDPTSRSPPGLGLALIIQDQRLDVSSEEESNWMRFIRPATSGAEQNLILHEVSGQLYFTSTREIKSEEELKVWYSEQYSAQHSLPPTPEETPALTSTKADSQKKYVKRFLSPTVGESLAEKSKKEGNGPNFTCEICQRKFEREASLLRHLALHKGEKSFTCQCGQKFSHPFNLERHRKKVHNTDPAGQFVICSACNTWFPSSMVLKVHMFSHHPNKEEQNWTVEDAMAQSGKSQTEQSPEEMKFQCPSGGCECQYDTWLELVEHAADHGSASLPTSQAAHTQTGHVHKCELCYKIFATDTRLQKHMAVHGGDETKPLECSDCGKRFLTNSALAGHIKTHAHPGTLYDCPICGQEFEQVSSLKEHVYNHEENGVFTCPHCEKTFNEYPQIRKHIRAFHAEKRFPCTMCDKSFTGKDKLKIHMVRHSETKEFMCDDCGKQFKRKDKLREHVKRMHTSSTAKKVEKAANAEPAPARFSPKVFNELKWTTKV